MPIILGIYEALGYAIVITVLFLPVVWFMVYFLYELVRVKKVEQDKIWLEDPVPYQNVREVAWKVAETSKQIAKQTKGRTKKAA